jgi:hypothetical protein
MLKGLLAPRDASLPPILNNREFGDVLDAQIYDLLELVLQEHVNSWFSLITPDKAFLHRVTRICRHVIQQLEPRIAALDWPELLAVDLPRLLAEHFRDFHAAQDRLSIPSADGIARLYCASQPHVAFDIDRRTGKLPFVDPAYMAALADGILKRVLPPEDYAAASERHVVRDVLTYVVFANLFAKLARPWFIHQICTKVLARPASPPAGRSKGLSNWWQEMMALHEQSRSRSSSNYLAPSLDLAASVLQMHKYPFLQQLFLFLQIGLVMLTGLGNRCARSDQSTLLTLAADL